MKRSLFVVLGFVAAFFVGTILLSSGGCGMPTTVYGGCDTRDYENGCCGLDDPKPCPEVCPPDGTCIARDAGTEAIACSDQCAKSAAEGWSGPYAVWLGEKQFAMNCPPELGPEVHRYYASPTADPPICNPCLCHEPKDEGGVCSRLPESIEVHAATTCGAGQTLPFGGPDAWDGSCTSANAVPAGAKCGGALCAQSVSVSPLGAPVEQGCEPYSDPPEDPKLGNGWHGTAPEWTKEARLCELSACTMPGDTATSCARTVDLDAVGKRHEKTYHACITRSGDLECPSGWSDERFLVYDAKTLKGDVQDNGILDKRECSACSCGEPMGGLCLAHFRVYEDSACSKLISDTQIASIGGQPCTNVYPPGLPLGSKEIVDLKYIPGACEPSVSEPGGYVEPNPTHAVTLCCSLPPSPSASGSSQ